MPTDALRTRLGNRLLRDEALSRYTAARLGGPADWLYVAQESIEELAEVVAEAWAHEIPVRIIGGGANVLVSDKGIRGLVIINHISEIKTGNWPDGRVVSATAGTSLTIFSRIVSLESAWCFAFPVHKMFVSHCGPTSYR